MDEPQRHIPRKSPRKHRLGGGVLQAGQGAHCLLLAHHVDPGICSAAAIEGNRTALKTAALEA
jgi:hypothetical protein